MAAITAAQIWAKKDALHNAASRCACIVAKPDAIDDATAGVFLVKDPDPGDTPNTTANQQGNAKGGDTQSSTTTGNSWKSYSYANLATAYGV